MSSRARYRAALSTPGLTLAERAVWALLSGYANEEGVCWPSAPTLARQLQIHPRTVKKATAELTRRGLIERVYDSGREAWRVVVDLTRWSTIPDHGDRAMGAPPRAMGAPMKDPHEGSARRGGEGRPSSPPPPAAPSVPAEQPAGRPDTAARELVVQLHQVAGVTPPVDPARLIAGAARLLEQATVGELVSTARAAVAAKPAAAERVLKALSFTEDWARVQIAARAGAPPPPTPEVVAQRAAEEYSRTVAEEREREAANERARAKLLADQSKLPAFLRSAIARRVAA